MALHPKIIAHEKMTKKFLMSLPEGVFIQSGVSIEEGSLMVPELAETVAPKAEREKQWEKIKKLYVNNRMCVIFRNKEDYLEYLDTSILGKITKRPDWAL